MRHLLVTNDFPPKIGAIQSYLWELWRRLPPEDVTVVTTSHLDAPGFDPDQPFRIERVREPVLLPSPGLTRRLRRLVDELDAKAVILDPVLPLGMVGRNLRVPYGLILHGAEVTVPGRLPASRQLLARVVRSSSLLIAAGGYPEAEARHAVGNDHDMPPVVRIPPGVDTVRFSPLSGLDRAGVRARLGLPVNAPLILSVSRLVPRKGMDTLIEAAARLAPRFAGLTVAVAGVGRDRTRLEHLIKRSGAPVRLLGHVPNIDLPALYASADVFAMSCRSRWRGLEQEGFGIVFLEAAAAGVPSVAGNSGGSAEAVVDGQTGTVIARPDDPALLAEALARLLSNPEMARQMGVAARRRAVQEYAYDPLAERLAEALEKLGSQANELRRRKGADARRGGRTLRCLVVEDSVEEQMVIASTPQHCFEVLTDFERYPEWAADIKAVNVDERDGDGRATVVTFRAAAFGRSTSYTLRYDYSAAPRELSWVQTAGDITRRLDGHYVIDPSGDGATEVRYQLVVDLKVPLPGFVKRRAEGRIMGTALRELKTRVEGS